MADNTPTETRAPAPTSRTVDFFNDVAALARLTPGRLDDLELIVVTHAVPTCPHFVAALSRVARIGLLIPKPKSRQAEIVDQLQAQGIQIEHVFTDDDKKRFQEDEYVVRLVSEKLSQGARFVILDMGGYFAETHRTIAATFPDRFVGVVEDTENGHQKYEAIRRANQIMDRLSPSPGAR